ncbi:MAG TPA: prolyl oligopeptidase family serine peptidase, partial [Isosphaeraceae bacterium]|nr:prolyl oligopeptidase family serine peptidase [Isosphaeraceae bacterium]
MRASLLLTCLVLGCMGTGPRALGADDGAIQPLDLQVLRPAGDARNPPPRTMLHRYLLEQAHRHFEARRQAIAAIKTPQDIARRQNQLRAFFLDSLGDLPERTPLNPRVVGTLARDGYRVEKVLFESRPGHHVTASLYLPGGTPPFPGVLLPCGHSDNGKAFEGYQRACILLARNGMAVLCYDPIGQGERFQRLDAQGKPVIRGTTEHTMAGIGALLIGRQAASYRIWDGLRALDYLAGRPEVDPSRLGCTGNSGGGTLTSYLMALDDRIGVAAPSCYITSLERLFATIGPQDAEQNITGQVAAGLEHADYITLRAPRPTLLTVGTRDFFDIQGSWNTFREVKLIYGRLGHGERVDLFESDEGHGFTRPRRIATARWMKRWLLKLDEAVDEPDFPIATDAELQCTRTGQVLSDFHGRSVFDLNVERERALHAARDAANARRSIEEFRQEVKKHLGLGDRKIAAVTPREVAKLPGPNCTIRKLTFEVEPGIVIPALDIAPGQHDRQGAVVVKVGVDWTHDLASEKAIDALMRPAARVVLVHPRGMGETDPAAGQERRGSPFGHDVKEAFLAIHLARPLLGQRVVDVLTVLEGLKSESGGAAGFQLVGIGAAGPVVLHAAVLDEKGLIQDVALERSLISWSDVVARGISRGQLG